MILLGELVHLSYDGFWLVGGVEHVGNFEIIVLKLAYDTFLAFRDVTFTYGINVLVKLIMFFIFLSTEDGI